MDIEAESLLASLETRPWVLQGIDERLTRVGPRSQGWTIFLAGEPIAWYERNPMLFVQTFHVDVSPRGFELGFHSVATENPYHEMCHQWLLNEQRIEATDKANP